MRKSANIAVLLAFAVAYLASYRFGFTWALIVPGILLLFFLPGYNLNSIILRNSSALDFPARLGLDVVSSIAILTLVNIPLSNRISYGENDLVVFVVILNLILALSKHFVPTSSGYPSPSKISRVTLFIWFIPMVFFIIRLILNPYIFEIDSLHYFEAYKDILKSGVDTGYLFNGRQAFPFYFSASHYLAGLNYVGFFKFFIPLVFYLGAGSLFAILEFPKRPWLKWLYLLILSSPMVAIMNEGVRPETFSLIFTIPVLVSSFLAIKDNSFWFGLLSALYAVAAFRFHEGAAVLLIAVSLMVLTMLVVNARMIATAIKNNLWISLAIAIPYILLGKIYSNSIISMFTDNAIIDRFYTIFVSDLSNISWDWWFLDNATTDLGAKISWPGLSAIWYYLYGGITALLFLVVLLVFRKLLKNNQSKEISWITLIPIIGFLIFHLAMAELFPRVGILIMYNRSWPYVALGSVILAVILARNFFQSKKMTKADKWLFAGIAICALSGIIGSTYGSTSMGGMVLPQEKEAIDIIRKLPENSLIVSTQRNHNLVRIYGNKHFVQITNQPQYDPSNFNQTVDSDTDQAIVLKGKMLKAMERVYESYSKRLVFNNFSKSIDSNTVKIEDSATKLPLLEKYNPVSYSLLSDKLNYLDTAEKDIYFLYSFAKLDHGILATRDWWRVSSDETNYKFFKEYNKPVAGKSDDYILIKIR